MLSLDKIVAISWADDTRVTKASITKQFNTMKEEIFFVNIFSKFSDTARRLSKYPIAFMQKMAYDTRKIVGA